MSKALLLIDIQKDYFPGGRCELFEPEKALGNALKALNIFRAEKGISELVVCGMMTHMCIDTTVRAAKDFQIFCHSYT